MIKTRLLIGIIVVGGVLYLISFVKREPIFRLLSEGGIDRIFSIRELYRKGLGLEPSIKDREKQGINSKEASVPGYLKTKRPKEAKSWIDRFLIPRDIGANKFLGSSNWGPGFTFGSDITVRYRVKAPLIHRQNCPQDCDIIWVGFHDSYYVFNPLKEILETLVEFKLSNELFEGKGKEEKIYLGSNNQAIIYENVYGDKEILWFTQEENVYSFKWGKCVPEANLSEVLNMYSIRFPSVINRTAFDTMYTRILKSKFSPVVDFIVDRVEEDKEDDELLMGVAYCIENNFGYLPFKEVNKRYSKMVKEGRKEEARKYLGDMVIKWLKANRNTSNPYKFWSSFRLLSSECVFEVDSNGISCRDLNTND